MGLSELDILARIRALLPGGATLTDDCGALPAVNPGETLLVTTDVMEEGTHFRMDWHPPRQLGRKVLAVNLSDLDASGARPLGVTLTLALPPELDSAWLQAFLEGLAEGLRESQIPVLGGDTVGRSQGIGLGMTAFGAARRWLRRDGLQIGDRIFVDQPLGASLRGLKKLQAGHRWDGARPDADLAAHLDPRPRLGLGVRLAELPEVHACLDLSDGLSRDLRNLAQASKVSIRVDARLGADALYGGEDYTRCFGSSLDKQSLESRLGLPLLEVGEVLEIGASPVLLYDGSSVRPLDDLSHEHFPV